MSEMYFIVNAVILLALIIIAIIDIWKKKVPSFMTTLTILLAFIFYFDNLVYGIIAFLFGLVLYEMDWMSGIADLKGTVILGLLAPTMFWALVTPLFIVVIGNAYIFCVKKISKERDPVAFFPIFPIIYIGLWILYVKGGVI
jgi:hypothetical protein